MNNNLFQCQICGEYKSRNEFIRTRNVLFKNNLSPYCCDCIDKIVYEQNLNWNDLNKMCQFLDIPFIPNLVEERRKNNEQSFFSAYCKTFEQEEYSSLNWKQYEDKFKELKQSGLIDREIPLLNEQKEKDLKRKWGANYDIEELDYLENLYQGLLNTQNVNGEIQDDQAFKICKISLEIDNRIRSGEDFDKLLNSYDKMVKIAGFTSKNAKEKNDFDSIGELIKWFELKGFKAKYYDGVTKDIVDETIKNVQNYNRRLYTNESGIGDEITQRIENLKNAASLETFYQNGTSEDDLDEYDNQGFEELSTLLDGDFE